MPPTELASDWVLEAGRQAGLSECGITSCEKSAHAERLDAWLERGAHGAMAWMARTAGVRKDLQSKWSWARSALVGVLDYNAGPEDRTQVPGLARHISRYARGEDYHDLLKRRLGQWALVLEGKLGREFRYACLVDTSAVLEREMAVRAGLGWFGRNTCLIGPRGNSWRFVGVLLTELDLLPTGEPATERCGTCMACLEACPTGALPEPHFLDANRCISYLTIEHRGPIPDSLREGLGDWIFGCDICQEVCPWNRRAEAVAEPAFKPHSGLEGLSLAQVVRMDQEQFRHHFRKTPLARPKRAGLVRNALIAGANIGDAEVIAAAEELLDDPDEAVRETARWVVQRGSG